ALEPAHRGAGVAGDDDGIGGGLGHAGDIGRPASEPNRLAVLVIETLQRLRQPGLLADLATLLGGGVQLGGGNLLVLRHVQRLVQLALLLGRARDPLLGAGHGGLLSEEENGFGGGEFAAILAPSTRRKPRPRRALRR